MSKLLWTLDELVQASGGVADGVAIDGVSGISIDTRTIENGDLFVALTDVRDGHDFVTAAFGRGAAAALVAKAYARKPGDGLLVRVDDPLKALERLAAAARARLAPNARVVAVTGSAGKTTTKEMLRACFAAIGRTHASEKSYNNHWGVPLTLARMPADTQFAVIEIGMNHAGEIRPLSQLARPHVALITTVAAVHLAQFDSIEGIADAKAEIFEGLEESGIAILPADNPHFARLKRAAAARGAQIRSFGEHPGSDLRIDQIATDIDGDYVDQRVDAVSGDGKIVSFGMSLAGAHMRANALAAILAIQAAGADLAQGLSALDDLQPQPGRGERTLLSIGAGKALLIDESYNANPASMEAAIETAREFVDGDFRRLVLVLGDMLELGVSAPQMHADLAGVVERAGGGRLFTCGPMMQHLFDAVEAHRQGAHAPDASVLLPLVRQALRPGDVVMVKASNGSKLGPLVAGLRQAFTPLAAQKAQ